MRLEGLNGHPVETCITAIAAYGAPGDVKVGHISDPGHIG